MTKNKENIIYGLIDPRTNQVRYIGKTIQNLRKRLQHHLNENATHHRACWIKGLKSEGLVPNIFEIETVPTGEDWKEYETFWISYFKFIGSDLVNRTEGGEGVEGLQHTDESKQKMSKSHRGKKLPEQHKKKISNTLKELSISNPDVLRPHKGKTFSEEVRKNMGFASKRRWQDPEFRKTNLIHMQNLAIKRTGLPLSDETRQKISNAHKGKKLSEEHKANIGKTHKKRGIKPPSMKGKKFTEEHRRKIAESNIGKTLSAESKRKISESKTTIFNQKTINRVIELFKSGESQRSIARKTGISRFHVKRIIKEKH